MFGAHTLTTKKTVYCGYFFPLFCWVYIYSKNKNVIVPKKQHNTLKKKIV